LELTKQKLLELRLQLIEKLPAKAKTIKVQVKGYIPATVPDKTLNFLYCMFRFFYVCFYFYFLPFGVLLINYFQLFQATKIVQVTPGIFARLPKPEE
jgi:hypothetical protein